MGYVNNTVTFESYRDFPGYIINLDRELWRYTAARHQLTSLGFSNISRWIATDYRKEDVNLEIRRMGATRLERFVNDAEIALVLSHCKIWADFLSKSAPYCLVFEDDVVGVEDFHNLADFKDLDYGDFDVLCFGGVYLDLCPAYGQRSYLSLDEAKQKQGGKSYLREASFWQSHAYLISRAGAYKAFLNYPEWLSLEEYRQPQIDNYLADCRKLNVVLSNNRQIGDSTKYSLHDVYSNVYGAINERICGVLLQRYGYPSTIQNT